MSEFTLTTNLSLKKPTIGGATDEWGSYLNEDLTLIDTAVGNLQNASTSRTLESLSNVLNLSPTNGQVLQFDSSNWKAATITIPDEIQDLDNVTVATPLDGQVLAYSSSNARWENQTPGAATIPNGTITTAKLDSTLQGQIGLILQTSGTPTDDQIVRYNASTSSWNFEAIPAGTFAGLTDTDVSAVSNGHGLIYSSSAGKYVAQSIGISDITSLQTTLDTKLESSDLSSYVTTNSLTTTLGDYVTGTSLAANYTETSSLTLQLLSNVTISSAANNDLLRYNGSAWVNSNPAAVRAALDLEVGTDIQAYDANTAKLDATTSNFTGILQNGGSDVLVDTDIGSTVQAAGSYITASSTDTLTNKSGNISMFTNDSGYLTAETNNLSNVSGTLAIANGGTASTTAAGARVALLPSLTGNGSKLVAVNSGADDVEYIATSTLSITESQITDLGAYITASSSDTLTNKSGNVSQFTNDSDYATTGKAIAMAIVFG